MKRRIGANIIVIGLSAAVFQAYHVASRDQEYRRLVQGGDTALLEGQTLQAIESFSGALALKPQSMLAHLKRGETYRQRGDLQAALRDLREAARLDPLATRPWEEIGDVNYALERDGRAIESYETYIGLDDRSPRVFYKLALARHRLGNIDGSISALQNAVDVDDHFAEAYYLLGLCFSERGRLDEATQSLERAITLQPAMIAPRELLAELYESQNRRQEELQQLEALAALDPGRAERYIALGVSYTRAGRPDLAVMALGRAAERRPDQPPVLTALGRVWLQIAEERTDRAALRKALDVLEPMASQPAASGQVLGLYGRALRLLADEARAEQVLAQATSKLPVDADTLLQLAMTAERLGHFDRARLSLITYDMLSSDEQQRSTIALRIADLSMRLNDFGQAVRWYQRAARSGPADPAIAQKLSEARSQLAERELKVKSASLTLPNPP